ncbi:hypothetical protein ElyMa_001929900 [Elysia marginata]|uniref:BESS domain-containing protein n=1 Tax=Elysia marginata TaxID=1093978 RepID=A0AAV4EVA5_9GAST|nr:hypothetical protein ElyMa_001929900 [Elysia marginata]
MDQKKKAHQCSRHSQSILMLFHVDLAGDTEISVHIPLSESSKAGTPEGGANPYTTDSSSSTVLATSIMTVEGEQSDIGEPLISSTPEKKCRRHLLLHSNLEPSSLQSTDKPTSSMKLDSTPETLTIDSSASAITHLIPTIKSYCKHQSTDSPITADEEKVAYFLVKKILAHSENKNLPRTKTGDQPLHFQRIYKPRKTSDIVSSPAKRNCTKHLKTIRENIAGKSTEAVSS